MHLLILALLLALVVGACLLFQPRKKANAERKKVDADRKKADANRKKFGAVAIFGIAVTLLLAAVEYGIVFALAIAAAAAAVAAIWYFLTR